ncbi:MAG: hypothetical protein ACYC33_06980 [Thermoleophilia bacterium]
MLATVITLIVMALVVVGAITGAEWIEQRQADRQAALQTQMQAFQMTQRLSALAWQTRQAMHQVMVEQGRRQS